VRHETISLCAPSVIDRSISAAYASNERDESGPDITFTRPGRSRIYRIGADDWRPRVGLRSVASSIGWVPSFLKVGLAFAYKDGTGFDIKLDAVPVTGQVVLHLKRHSAGQGSVDRP
jgi:hypothetical protein